MPFSKEHSTKATTATAVVRSGLVGVKVKGTFSGWIWKRRWLVLSETTLAFFKAESSSRPQKTIQLRDLTTVERTELKPFCVLLKTASRPRSTGKTYLLSFESDEELYRWQDEIYSRSALGSGMSGPSGFVHHVHVGFDALTSGFTGLPNGWERAVTGPQLGDEKSQPLLYDSTSGNSQVTPAQC